MQARMQDACSYLVMSEYLKPSLTLHALSGWPSLYLHMSTKLNPKKWPPGLRGLSHKTFAHCDCNCDCDGHRSPNSPCTPCRLSGWPSSSLHTSPQPLQLFGFLHPASIVQTINAISGFKFHTYPASPVRASQLELAHVNVPDFTQSGSQGGNQALGVAGEPTQEGPVGHGKQ